MEDACADRKADVLDNSNRQRKRKHEFTGSSSSLMDPEVVIPPETSPNSISKKLKQNEEIFSCSSQSTAISFSRSSRMAQTIGTSQLVKPKSRKITRARTYQKFDERSGSWRRPGGTDAWTGIPVRKGTMVIHRIEVGVSEGNHGRTELALIVAVYSHNNNDDDLPTLNETRPFVMRIEQLHTTVMAVPMLINACKVLPTADQQVGSHEEIEIDGDEDPAGGLIIGEKVDADNKGKATYKVPDKNWQNQFEVYVLFFQDPLDNELMVPTSAADFASTDGVHPPKNFALGSHNPINLDAFNSDFLYDDDDDDDDDDAGDDEDIYDDDDDDYNDDLTYDDDYLSLQAQFDTVDLPPGVEASVPWLQDPAQSEKKPADPSSSTSSNFQTQYNAVSVPSGIEVASPFLQDPAKNQQNPDATSSSIIPVESCSNGKEVHMEEGEVMNKFLLFKRFDTVQDFSDHHFTHGGSSMKQPSKNWIKKIQEEWKILEKDLPDTICVRVYEQRMDLLRAVIVGAAGTPYHDGLFFFDQVYYYSGGLRLNPNLYECGKVCLSLLNTWSGNKNEKWIPKSSTMLQVLVSIQGLILNAKPFFNEPGYERMNGEPEGDRRSRKYNESTFILSLRTMLYTLRRPPKHFEDFVAGHFRKYAHDILGACKAYMEGTQVGCLVKGGVQGIDEGDKSSKKSFKDAISKMVKLLVVAFTKNGAKDCEQFLPQSENSIERLDTTPTQ
ncbi:hypothetical protein HHK36_005317 [Tetracentron sinense]|uniref:E2 ubiquitin-conjugating enzyme n=1 Tax=Tetracentron sinense TaxID=13715 RepID=A0A835DM85_TETSI|nr:hypothetical protein HHK36_005317 [Tetracentron sinense]